MLVAGDRWRRLRGSTIPNGTVAGPWTSLLPWDASPPTPIGWVGAITDVLALAERVPVRFVVSHTGGAGRNAMTLRLNRCGHR